MGDVPFYAKIWPKLTHSLAKRRFSIYFRSYSASAVTPKSLYFPGLSRRLAAIHQNCIVISATGNGTYSLLKICLRDLLLSYIGPIWLVVPLLWNIAPPKKNKKLIRRWDSERELPYGRHRTHTTKYNRDSYINSATDRRRYVLQRRFTKVSEITQCNGHYTVQGHSRSPIWAAIEVSYRTSY